MNAIGEQISAILWNVFNRPRLIDLIDILLLTIIIYELLVHVRQTRVSQTIKGIIILLLATWLSDVLGMRTIHALLAWMINAGPVLLIVLFQSEMCVCDIAQLLNMTQSAISHQLRILKQSQLVKSRRDGKSVFYSLADDHVYRIINQGFEHIKE